MLGAVDVLVAPSGRAPRFGDSDDARGLPFFTEDLWDFHELLALGRAVMGPEFPLCRVTGEHYSDLGRNFTLFISQLFLPKTSAYCQPMFSNNNGYRLCVRTKALP